MLMNCCLKFVPAEMNQSSWYNAGEQLNEMKSLYKLANYNEDGLLPALYETEGSFATSNYLEHVLSEFIVQDTKLNCVSPTQADSKKFQYDGQECYWRPDRRGDHGETLVHVLIICNSETHSKIVRLLMQLYPSLAKDVMLQEQYFGKN